MSDNAVYVLIANHHEAAIYRNCDGYSQLVRKVKPERAGRDSVGHATTNFSRQLMRELYNVSTFGALHRIVLIAPIELLREFQRVMSPTMRRLLIAEIVSCLAHDSEHGGQSVQHAHEEPYRSAA